MKIGIDSSVIVAGVHANHPRHAAAAQWLVQALTAHELIVCHHSVLESYAVLTSPGRSCDAFTACVLHASGARAISTLNPKRFAGLIEGFQLIDPGEIGGA